MGRESSSKPDRRLDFVVVALVAAVFRFWTIWQIGWPSGGGSYDGGAYFSAAGLLVNGVWPFRDFAHSHPPGAILLLAPLALIGRAVGYDVAFVAAHLVIAMIGAANAVLVAALAWRLAGRTAGLTAGLIYATSVIVVSTESAVMLEPLLTLFVLLATVLAFRDAPSRRAVTGAFLLLGISASMKEWGVFMVPLFLLSVHFDRPIADRLRGGAVALVGFLTPLVPFLIAAGSLEPLRQIVANVTERPRPSYSLDRLVDLFGIGPIGWRFVAWPVGAVGLAATAALAMPMLRRPTPLARFLALWLVVMAVVFMAAPTFYSHYAAFATPPIAVLVSAGLARGSEVLPRMSRRFFPALAAGLVLVTSARTIDRARPDRADDFLRAAVHQAARPGECLYSDNSALTLVADRLPVVEVPGQGLIVDSFLVGLHNGADANLRNPLLAPRVQAIYRRALAACPLVALDVNPATSFRWSSATQAWFLRTFDPVATDRIGRGLYRRRDS